MISTGCEGRWGGINKVLSNIKTHKQEKNMTSQTGYKAEGFKVDFMQRIQ